MSTFSHFYRLSLLLFSFSVVFSTERKKSVLDNIVETMKHASNYFDIAKDVANLVSTSLKRKESQKRGDDGGSDMKDEVQSNVVSGFFRLLGLDSRKIIAIAVNSVIFLAQLISSLFDLNPKIEQMEKNNLDEPAWDPLKYVMENNNKRIKRLVDQAQDPGLPNLLINGVDGFDSSCVRQLLCKTSPVIWAAQNSLKNKSIYFMDKLISWLPSWQEFEDNSETCEERHNDCLLFTQ